MSIRRSFSWKIVAAVLAVMVAVSMSATLLPSYVYADEGQTGQSQLEKDVQGFIEKADEPYAHYITETLATQYPDVDNATIDPEHGMKYDPEGKNAYGFRNAGSKAEQQAAEFLKGEFEGLGLDQVKLDAVNVDKWEYGGATFEMDGMLMEDPICSYASSGTDVNGVTGEVVYLGDLNETSGAGTGYEWAYEAYYDEHGLKGKDRNMNGKIVVADIHQYADSWITPYYVEAYHQGAAALVTYSYQYCNEDGTQTGTKWDHAVQIQDLCSSNYGMPCVAISRCDGLKIKEQIKGAYEKKLTPTATLTVDNTVEPGGKSYNVVGTLKGTGNTGQRIVISGHYDKYWFGYNDDCAAVGNVFGVAKAMVDSGYKPINDIVFIAHGAEEWGQTDTETDWATGSWQELYTAHPEWQGTTLAMINFELPAMRPDTLVGGSEVAKKIEKGAIGSLFGCTEQVSEVLDSFVDGNLMEQVNKSTGKEVVEVTDRYYHAQPMSDAYGWQFLGVPCYEIRGYYGPGDDFSIYHTPFDDVDHYANEAMDWCIKATAAFAAQIDQSPAVEFSTTKIADKLKGSIDVPQEGGKTEMSSIYAAAGVNTKAFKAEVDKLKAAGDEYLKNAKEINEKFRAAVADSDTETAAALLEEGTALNKYGMAAFRECQDDILVVLGDSDAATRNESIQLNWNLLEGAVACLESPEEGAAFGALDLLWQINGAIEYTTYCFSDWTAANAQATVDNSKLIAKGESNRSIGHKAGYVNTHTATYKVYHTLVDGAEGLASEGFKNEIATYKKAMNGLKGEMKTAMARETTAVKKMTALYQYESIAAPAKVKKVKVKNQKGKKVKVTWASAKNAAKYQVAYKVKGAKKWKTKTTSNLKYTVKKLKKGKKYQFKVRGISKFGDYGKWSKIVTVKVKR